MNNLGNKAIMAKNIQYYMDEKSISRKKLATDLNISYTTLSSWLQAESYPRIEKIELMANYFGISKSNLVEDHSRRTLIDLDDMINNAHSFDGKPMTDHDKEIIKSYLKGYYSAKEWHIIAWIGVVLNINALVKSRKAGISIVGPVLGIKGV